MKQNLERFLIVAESGREGHPITRFKRMCTIGSAFPVNSTLTDSYKINPVPLCGKVKRIVSSDFASSEWVKNQKNGIVLIIC